MAKSVVFAIAPRDFPNCFRQRVSRKLITRTRSWRLRRGALSRPRRVGTSTDTRSRQRIDAGFGTTPPVAGRGDAWVGTCSTEQTVPTTRPIQECSIGSWSSGSCQFAAGFCQLASGGFRNSTFRQWNNLPSAMLRSLRKTFRTLTCLAAHDRYSRYAAFETRALYAGALSSLSQDWSLQATFRARPTYSCCPNILAEMSGPLSIPKVRPVGVGGYQGAAAPAGRTRVRRRDRGHGEGRTGVRRLFLLGTGESSRHQ